MKKLLIASLVLGMLIVFTGVASAAPVWWLSTTEITHTFTGTKEKTQTNTNTTLVTDNRTVKGYLVMETAGDTVPATNAIDQIFFCGTATTVTTPTTTTDFELLFPVPYGAIATDTLTLKAHPHNEAGHIYAAGNDAFLIQTADIPVGTATGPADLYAAVTYALNDATVIESVSVNGAVTVAFPQVITTTNPISDTIFTGAFTTELKATTDTAICCCNGVITTNGSCPCGP